MNLRKRALLAVALVVALLLLAQRRFSRAVPSSAVALPAAEPAAAAPHAARRAVGRASSGGAKPVVRAVASVAPPALAAAPECGIAAARSSDAACVSGTVVDVLGGSIAGALVSVMSPRGHVATTRSSPTGSFQLLVPRGHVTLDAEVDGYGRATLQAQAPATDVTIALAPASELAGTVQARSDHRALQGVTVSAWNADGTAPALGVTDAAGHFRIGSLSAGSYELSAIGAQYRSRPLRVRLSVAEARDDLLLEAERGAGFTGLARVGGAPCSEGEVLLVGPSSEARQLSEQGSVDFGALLPGSYRLTIDCNTAALRQEGLLEIGDEPVSRTWELEPGIRLVGRVEAPDGAPLAGVTVHVRPLAHVPGAASRNCSTDAEGRFSCPGLLAGGYDAQVLRDGDLPLSQSQRVWLSSSGSEPLVLRTYATGSLRVSFTGPNAAAAAGPDASEAIALSALQLLDAQRTSAPGTREGETLLFTNLPLGQYSLQLGVGSERPPEASVRLDQQGQTSSVSLPRPPLSSLEGRVVDARGAPVPDASVSARGASGALALSDELGGFRLERLLPGVYELQAEHALGTAALSGVSVRRRGIELQLVPRAPAGEERDPLLPPPDRSGGPVALLPAAADGSPE